MTRLFLAPVDEESYRATLENNINLSEWSDRPTNFPRISRVWGVRTDTDMGDWSRNQNRWTRMKEDDPILFYQKGNFFLDPNREKYFAKGRVGVKCETEYIRDNYWNGGPAVSIFSVNNYNEDINLKRGKVNEILQYKENFHPQGIWLVNEDRPVDRLLRTVGFS